VLRRSFYAPRIFVWAAIASLAAVTALDAQAQSNALVQPVVASRLTQPVEESSLVTLKGTVHPLANAKNDAGEAPADMQLTRVQLRLTRGPDQESALQQLIADLHSPGSASYHQWLTPAQFGQQFGPSDQDIQTIEAWVQSHGMTVGTLNAGKGTLEISGTVGQLEDTFHTSIHKYMVNGQPHYANASNPSIPAALAPVLGGFVSLNNFSLHRMSRTLGEASYNPQTHQAKPQWTVLDGSSPLGYDLVVAPQDYYTQYDLNPLYTAGTNGTGQTIAIINDSNINIAQVNNFRTVFGLSANPPQVIIDGNDPGIDGVNNVDGPDFDSGEAYLDVEWSGAVAPAATIDLVIGADTAVEAGLILAAERAVFSDLAPVMSVSFGACEDSLGSENAFLNGLWEQAAAEGITVLVSAGDNGSAGCDNADEDNVANGTLAQDGLAVSGFASTPYNVAMGGTDFFYSDYLNPSEVTTQLGTYWNPAPPTTTAPTQSTLKQVIPEQVWNDSQFGLNLFTSPTYTIAAGSGGPSTCGNPTLDSAGDVVTCVPYTKPSWQIGTGVPADGVRDIPDLSLFAADGMNNSFIPTCASDGDCNPGSSTVQITGVGGTSAAAPAMAGIMALINQLHGPQGQADFVLYPLATQFPAAFHDVVKGVNAVPCVIAPASDNCGSTPGGGLNYGQLELSNGSPAYSTTVGYDYATGLGSVDANVLVSDWSKVSFTATTATLTPSSTSFAHGTAITINTSVTGSGGTPTGTVALVTNSPVMSQQGQTNFTLSNGSASSSVSFLPGGTYSIWGQYSGNGTFGAATSSKTQITVTPEASAILSTVLTPVNGGLESVSGGVTIPYGTQIILDGMPFGSTFYTTCVLTNSTSTACETPQTFPTGSVTFSDNGTPRATAVINSEGDAEYSSGAYTIGAHSITASYTGDASYNSSTAGAITFNVAQVPAGNLTVTILPSQNPTPIGQPLVLTALVESGGIGATPSGTITFHYAGGVGSFPQGAVTLAPGTDPSTGATAGVATLTVTSLPFGAGAQTITAVYSGDTNYAATTGSLSLVIQAVAGLASTTTGTATVNGAAATSTSPTAGVLVTATVTGSGGGGAPAGSVAVEVLGEELTLLPLTAVNGTTSTATIVVNSQILLQGANPITLLYQPSATYQPSSATVAVTNPLSDFTMVAQAPIVTVAAGSSTTDTLNFTAVNGFSSAVALTCAAPAGITCSLNPASLSVSGNTSATLTINASSTSAALRPQGRSGWFLASGGAALAGVLLLGLPKRRRKWQALLGLLFIVIVTAGIGCGGGSGGNTPPPPVTPTGSNNSGNNGNAASKTYTVVVTGVPASSTISHNVAVSVAVQ
jgi:trimeric autotransporter adhesin